MLPRELLPALLVFGACVPMGSVGPLPAEDARVDPGHPDANTAADAGPVARPDAGTPTEDAGQVTAEDAGQVTAEDAGQVTPEDAGQVTVTRGGPVLFFTDLVNGPRAGNSDDALGQAPGAGGVIVSVWGKRFGASQGASTVTVGGVPAPVYYWGPATHGADLSRRLGLDLIEFLVPAGAPLGAAPIEVEVGGVHSNALAFTTRAEGAIYYVGPQGRANNPGTKSAPFADFDQAVRQSHPGDTIYLLDGYRAITGAFDTGLLNLNADGARDRPLAVVAYPGATVQIGGTVCEPTGHAVIANWTGALNRGSNFWVISKLRVTTPSSCEQDALVSLGDGYRLVGNYLSNPRTSDGCQSGAVYCGGLGTCGGQLRILGNELAFMQTANRLTGSKQCHGFYISGNRTEDGVESDREIGWNYLHDCDENRAINVYNESYNGAGAPRAMIEEHRIHDNWLENQRGIGILMGADVTGENWLYNNILVNVGLGPGFTDGGAYFPLQLQPGSSYSPRPTTLHVRHNLIYGGSYPGILNEDPNADYTIGLMYVGMSPMVTLDFVGNLMISTQRGVDYVSRYSDAYTSSHNLWSGAGAAPGADQGAIAQDPGFRDVTALDFHLGETSPARGVGSLWPEAPLDFDGIPRSSAGCNLGPYE
ncbi:MAG: hypothetical protein U1E65_03060 [Myxococcota bacterium]